MSRHQLFFFVLFSFFFSSSARLTENDNDLGFGRWIRPSLTYSVIRYPEHRRHPRMTMGMMKKHVDKCLDRAIEVWAPTINVFFKRIQDSEDEADIKIYFWSGEHFDIYPFDGRGGEVAHTFYPDEMRRGEIHIDDDEPWAPDGRNLEWVLAHELGHALGIPHQKGPSLMEEGYRGYHNRPALTQIDILAARRIYA